MALATTTAPPVASAVLADHRQLGVALAGLELLLATLPHHGPVSGWRGQLADGLSALVIRLDGHFDLEERNGLFESIRMACPQSAPRCRRLRADHHRLLSRAGALAVDAALAADERGSLRALALQVNALVADLASHEAEEAELLTQAAETDRGAPD